VDDPAAEPSRRYRPDVQGLRAVAVLLVVTCHSGLALAGGFVGVDVFFVVSGFVIGRVLLDELAERGSVSFGAFYARRARRLLPSLALVTVASVVGAVLLLNPYRAQPTALKSAGAATGFVANGYLYRHLGYFDAQADGRNPFLHLWSLSVEEQFYLVLPALALGAWALGRRLGGRRQGRGAGSPQGWGWERAAVAVAVGAIGAASLWLSWAMTTGRSPIALEAPVRFAFYASPTRFWELGVGVLLAAGERWVARVPALVGAAAGVVGAALVGWTALTLDPLAPFPGLAAVPPVAGTALLVVAGARSRPVATALSWRPLRWIGDRSYTWYLWHWPAAVYARVAWPASTWAPVAAAFGSLVPAAVAYRLVEHPIRIDPRWVGRRALGLAVVCMAVPGLLAAGALHQADTGGWGVKEPLDWYDTPSGGQAGCVIWNRDMVADWRADACTFPPPGPGPARGTVLVVGDTHADGVSTAVGDVVWPRGLAVAEWARAGCPMLGATPAHYPACEGWQGKVLALVDRLHPVLVVVANRSTAYTTDPDPAVGSNASRIRRPDGSEASGAAEAEAAWGAGLRALLDQLHRRGAAVLVVGPAPGFRDGFPRDRLSVAFPHATVPSRRRAEVAAERAGVVAAERRAVAEARSSGAAVRYVDPFDLLCPGPVCRPFRNGHWLYSGPFELNNRGSRLLDAPVADAVSDLLDTPR
jgi:peptidoglycan/LPS O-acetylase OafA/YrhL